MKKNLTIVAMVWILSFISMTLLAVSGGLSFWVLKTLADKNNDLSQIQIPAIRFMTMLDVTRDRIGSTVYRSFYLAKTQPAAVAEPVKQLDVYAGDVSKYMKSLASLDISGDAKGSLKQVETPLNEFVVLAKKIGELLVANNLTEAETVLQDFQTSLDGLEMELSIVADTVESQAQAKIKESDVYGSFAMNLQIIMLLLGFVLSLGVSYLVGRKIKASLLNIGKLIVDEAQEVKAASQTLHTTSEEVSEKVTEQAASLEETAASMEEIGSMVSLSLKSAGLAVKTSDETRITAEKGSEHITKLILSMETLVKSGKKVEQIIGMIDDVAFQTNLLALNAAVEAARAGDHGRGFGVVAEAVRNLAQKSASAAKEISDLIKSNVNETGMSATLAKQSEVIFQHILKNTNEIAGINKEIAEGCEAQSNGIVQITRAINQIDQSTQSNSVSSQQVALNSSDLSRRADGLLELSSSLKMLTAG